jgi:RimJ/RimL family protein N-acetyltransferase
MATSLLDTLAGTSSPDVAAAPKPATTPRDTEGIIVLPYNARFDEHADAFLPWMWKRMQEDDLVDYYFPGQKSTGFAAFVGLMSGGASVALVLHPDETAKWEDRVLGFVSWTDAQMGASNMIIAGFIFFRKFWDVQTTGLAGEKVFKYWFTDTPAEIVLGVCPALHHTAMRYNKRVGLHEIGRIPLAHLFKGEVCDAVLFALRKDEWLAKGVR